MAIRVFELARELGVTSKVILEKCRAEGIDLPNHMTALKAGLEATVREWFSEGENQTAVETAEHVDLKVARKQAAAQRQRHRTPEPLASTEETPVQQAEAATAVAEASAPPTVEAPGVPVGQEPAAPEGVHAAVEPPPAAPEAAPAPVAGTEAPVAAEPPSAPAEPPPPAKAEPPPRPKVIKPAGPQVVPRPAKLQGPRVVRFDGIEPEAVSRRPPAQAPVGGGRTGPPPAAGARRGEPQAADQEEHPKRAKRRSPRRKSGRSAETTEGLREWRDRDLLERSARLAAASGGTLRRHRATVGRARGDGTPTLKTSQVEMDEPITVKSLSAATGVKIAHIIRKLMAQGVMATVNSELDRDTAGMIALENGIELRVNAARSAEEILVEEFASRTPGEVKPRAPIVTFLGHVDHGKTSLLDRIRDARVAAGEEGGITQGIGAYRFDQGDRHVVFLDTPGHQAFTAMRARGANMTDVVVLVVAADDGVMPQTVEAISHAKAAEVPIVVALNKVDLPNANVQRALGQLAEHGLQPREWGGNTEVIRTSAATGEGVEKLVELLSLEAELLELKADPEAPASGYVVEAEVDPTRGIVATLLLRDGTLRVGDSLLAGKASGRVRRILDDRGRLLEEAGPATPVQIMGLDEVPDAGDRFFGVGDITRAKTVAAERRERQRPQAAAAGKATSLEGMFERLAAGESSEVRLIVKVDVQGSLEALLRSLEALNTEEVKVVVLHSGVGGVTEGDVLLAQASQALVIGFRVVADQRARMLAEQEGVEVRTYRVIYQVIEDVQKAVQGMLAPEMAEKVLGRAEVREVFRISRVGTVAGCYVTDGVITRSAKLRIIRNNVVVQDERELESLRRFKDDAREVRAGLECGVKIAGYDDVKVGDALEAYQSVEVSRQ